MNKKENSPRICGPHPLNARRVLCNENGLHGGRKRPALQTLLPCLVRGLQREEGDGCYASYPSSVTFGASFPQGGSLETAQIFKLAIEFIEGGAKKAFPLGGRWARQRSDEG